MTGSEFDDKIADYRERFELIIKTEGENSTSGTRYASNQRTNFLDSHPGRGGGQYQTMSSHGNGGNGQLTEKQMSRNEKALSGMV